MPAKSCRNKTINTTLEEGTSYLSRCISVVEPKNNISEILDKTILGDMFSVCPMLPRNSVDLLIADPPYNLTKSFSSTRFVKVSKTEYENYTRRWISAVKPLLKETASIYICCDWESSLIIGRILPDFFCVRNRITWQREKGRGAKANWKNSMEDIWFATTGNSYTFNLDAVKIRKRVIAPYHTGGQPKGWEQTDLGRYRDTCPSNFWDDITIPFWSMPENTAHPTQKPEKLIAKMILASSTAGGVVFDPFLGSGTTSVTAKKLGRRYIGIEKEKQYCIWAEQRLEQAGHNTDIQGYRNGIFFDRNILSGNQQ